MLQNNNFNAINFYVHKQLQRKKHFSNDVEQIRFKRVWMTDELLTAVLPPQCQNLQQTLENLSLTIESIICCTNMLSVITLLILKILKIYISKLAKQDFFPAQKST